MNGNSNRRPHSARWATAAFAALVAAAAADAKPPAATMADVQITFGGQTFGFSGPEESFSQSAEGGRIVFEPTQLQKLGYTPLPDVDIDALEAHGNRWIVQPNLVKHSYAFVGTCASQTYTTTESGVIIRHLNLNCSEFDADAAP